LRLSLVIFAVASAFIAAGVAARTASACCIWTPGADRIAGADVIFEGVALEGATEPGIQRFRVMRYLKSTGPETVSVKTGYVLLKGTTWAYASTTVAIRPDAGSEWRIFGYQTADGVLTANSCTSRMLPLPPLGEEPPPSTPPPTTDPAIQGPRDYLYPAVDKSGSGVANETQAAPEATPLLKTSAPRPKAKQPRLAKKNMKAKKAKKRTVRVSRRASRR
jgi:hypothetical protein